MGEDGNLRVFNPAQDIAREVTLDVIIRHRDALKQCREGKINNDKELTENERKINKIKGLFLIISAQRDMINISQPIIWFECERNYKKKNDTEEKRKEFPFEDEDNDYNDIREIKEELKLYERDLIDADETETEKDDYLIKKQIRNQIYFKLTSKYFDLIDALEETYRKIYFSMIKYKIVSAGLEENEELSYRELEKEAINKIQEA